MKKKIEFCFNRFKIFYIELHIIIISFYTFDTSNQKKKGKKVFFLKIICSIF